MITKDIKTTTVKCSTKWAKFGLGLGLGLGLDLDLDYEFPEVLLGKVEIKFLTRVIHHRLPAIYYYLT